MTPNSNLNLREHGLDTAQLTEALRGFEQERHQIEQMESAIRVLLGKTENAVPDAATTTPSATKEMGTHTPRRRNLSPEGRKKIQEAMRKRWANTRKGKSGKSARTRTMSDEARKKISDKQRARWAGIRAAQGAQAAQQPAAAAA